MNPAVFLGIETSGTSTGLALAVSGRVVAELVEHSSCGHNEVLMPLLDRLLKGSGRTARDLSGIGVDLGPGMFTSLRVGLSTAKGLAVAHRIPVKGVNTLWSLARTARGDMDRVLSVMDARKHQVYAALYLEGRPAIPPSIMGPEQLVSEVRTMLPGRTSLVVAGSGASVCADLFAVAGVELQLTSIEIPSPGVVALEAAERIAGGMADDVAAIEPIYLRRTDAELAREQKIKPGI
ncbi:MAG: tRNA (adenosine(37)-N6)-threonylcarbamoyltransferase complex dimerization subunit type 1 TsaB [candidate division WOR-3 bacterium]|nr:tRNA (adenosine(37)-N6)-threonylcarbamoyltransferase complex dimerization subunit type 1 TsaB [candidate division WOR-3 bacterium]